MKLRLRILLLLCLLVVGFSSTAQTANINWDNLDYLATTNINYSTYITPALFTNTVQTQSFAIGVNRLTIGTNFTAANILGEDILHTGETGSYGVGADVHYTGNGIITMTFDNAVTALKFSLYDVDMSARTQVSALDAFGGNVSVSLSSAIGSWATSVFTPTPVTTANTSVGISPRVDATLDATNQANNINKGVVNVDIASSVKTITITVSNNTGDPDFWLSDIQANVTGSFPTNYYTISKPWTGQPAYVLAVSDKNTIYMIDPATGRAVSLFTDNTPRVGEINDLAYDPYNRFLYYSVDGLERAASYGLGPNGLPDSVRYIRKYDFNTGTISQIINNVNNTPFNIPTFTTGLESGSACFYNGSLFVGVEGTKTSTFTTREAMIWRIDFDLSNNPKQACQVYGTPADVSGPTTIHDWGDISIKDGILYDFNSINTSSVGSYNIINLQTNVLTNTYAGVSTTDKPRQVAQQWDGSLIWLHDKVATYNGTNVLGTKFTITATSSSVPFIPGAGDGAEAFKPQIDFGDAPSSYDPVALAPAMHEKDTAIHIGAQETIEWSKLGVTSVEDNFDDGLAYVPNLAPGATNYLTQVSVYNNTGANATLIAWLDYNGDGIFNASEALAPITVTSKTTTQLVYLYWPAISSSIAKGTYTYLRIRFTSASASMTSANATGAYYLDGEVEDYKVLADFYPLTVNLLSFDAEAINNNKVQLTWKTSAEENFKGFEIQRSSDGVKWIDLDFVNTKGTGQSATNVYNYTDDQPLKGKLYYRLNLVNIDGKNKNSETRIVHLKEILDNVIITPNPAANEASVLINADKAGTIVINVIDLKGRTVSIQNAVLFQGNNNIDLKSISLLPNGTYIVKIAAAGGVTNKKLIISK